MLVTAIRLCEQKRERLRISIKGKKITPINTRALFSKAANWNCQFACLPVTIIRLSFYQPRPQGFSLKKWVGRELFSKETPVV